MTIAASITKMGQDISHTVDPLVHRETLVAAATPAAEVIDASYFMFHDGAHWKYVSAVELEKNLRSRKEKHYEFTLSATAETNTFAIDENIADIRSISMFVLATTSIVPPALTGPSYAYNYLVTDKQVTVQVDSNALATLGGKTVVITIGKR